MKSAALLFAIIVCSSATSFAKTLMAFGCKSTRTGREVSMRLDFGSSLAIYRFTDQAYGFAIFSNSISEDEYSFVTQNPMLWVTAKAAGSEGVLGITNDQGEEEEFTCEVSTMNYGSAPRCPHGVCENPPSPHPAPAPGPCRHGVCR